MEKVKYRYNRWRLALGRLVNLHYEVTKRV